MEDGQKITKIILGENKVITPEQQFLCIILFFFVFKMAMAIAFLCKNAVEAIQISFISMILSHFYSILAKKRNSHGHLK